VQEIAFSIEVPFCSTLTPVGCAEASCCGAIEAMRGWGLPHTKQASSAFRLEHGE